MFRARFIITISGTSPEAVPAGVGRSKPGRRTAGRGINSTMTQTKHKVGRRRHGQQHAGTPLGGVADAAGAPTCDRGYLRLEAFRAKFEAAKAATAPWALRRLGGW